MRKRLGFLGVAMLVCAAMVSAAAVQQKPAVDAPVAKKAEVAPAETPKPEDPALKPAREALAAFANAYNTADVTAMAGLFTDDASVVDSNGDEVRGKAAIVEMYTAAFEEAAV